MGQHWTPEADRPDDVISGFIARRLTCVYYKRHAPNHQSYGRTSVQAAASRATQDTLSRVVGLGPPWSKRHFNSSARNVRAMDSAVEGKKQEGCGHLMQDGVRGVARNQLVKLAPNKPRRPATQRFARDR